MHWLFCNPYPYLKSKYDNKSRNDEIALNMELYINIDNWIKSFCFVLPHSLHHQ